MSNINSLNPSLNNKALDAGQKRGPGTDKPNAKYGLMMDWAEFKKVFLQYVIINEFIEKMPHPSALKKIELDISVLYHGGYCEVIRRLKDENVLSPEFRPTMRSLVKKKMMPEGLAGSTIMKEEPNPHLEGKPVQTKRECRALLLKLFGDKNFPGRESLQAIIDAAREQGEALDEEERHESESAKALLRYSREHATAWGELEGEWKGRRTEEENRQRRERALKEARASLEQVKKTYGDGKKKIEMPPHSSF